MSEEHTPPPADPVPGWLLALPAPVEPERQRVELLLPAATVRRLAELAQAEGRPVEDVAAEQLARALDRPAGPQSASCSACSVSSAPWPRYSLCVMPRPQRGAPAMQPHPLVLDLLDAAGFDLAQAADGRSWAAVDRVTGYEWGLCCCPAGAAREALAVLRRRYVEALSTALLPPWAAGPAAQVESATGAGAE